MWRTAVRSALLLAIAAPAWAQTAPKAPSRVEIGGGVAWMGGGSFASVAATILQSDGTPLTLFTTTSSLAGGAGAELSLDIRITRRLWVEATGSWTHPQLRTSISGDFESAPAAEAVGSISQFTLEGSGIWYFSRHGALEPYARGGVGWLRQLSADQALYKDGLVANAGGGLKIWLSERDRGFPKRIALRLEGRLAVRSGTFTLGTKSRIMSPAFAVGVIVGF